MPRKDVNGDSKEKIIDVRSAGHRGGNETLRRYGSEHSKRIGRKGGKTTSKKYKEMLASWGQLGGRPKSPKIGEPP